MEFLNAIIAITLTVIVIVVVRKGIIKNKCKKLEEKMLTDIGLKGWSSIPAYDDTIVVKSRRTLEIYDEIKYFKNNRDNVQKAGSALAKKQDIAKKIKLLLQKNEYANNPDYRKIYPRVEPKFKLNLNRANYYCIHVMYISSAGNNLANKIIQLSQSQIDKYLNDPTLLMNKSELNKYFKEKLKVALEQKYHEYYDKVNKIVDYVSETKNSLVIKNSKEQLDDLIEKLFDRTVNSIKKIKTTDSEEWEIIGTFIDNIQNEIEDIVNKNQNIINYYDSPGFLKIKETCTSMMSSQREFNEYIDEKVKLISELFGTRVARTETQNEDQYDYVRPYKKTLNPFVAEVSSAVFASAENKPLEYVIKNFYPNSANYPEQIQKLQFLVQELETLREAKVIIDKYKTEYDQYLTNVPALVMEEDKDGFYARLGFANISEDTLTIEYEFSYTSGGGMAKRVFKVPMTEETIVELIDALENKLTLDAFSKEQRTLMTEKLRTYIKERDNYTCCNCGNSIYNEPNLLLEIDHIVPIAKGGITKEDNLQTLCWKCNRSKGAR